MQIYFHSRLWSYLPRVPILVEGTVLSGVIGINFVFLDMLLYSQKHTAAHLHFVNQQGPRFQQKIFTVLLKKISHLHLGWPDE